MSDHLTQPVAAASGRTVTRLVRGVAATDGAGVRLNRIIGTPALEHVDPFLLFDEFKSDDPAAYIAGFPDHPHRGFETVTYLLHGELEHRDNRGNRGLLGPGGAQWMTAARGIVHSEMPRQREGLLWGFQLWINLPAQAKMGPPRYQDIAAASIPELSFAGGVSAKLVAGMLGGTAGPAQAEHTEPLYVVVTMPPASRFNCATPVHHTAFAYVFDGTAAIGGEAAREVPSGTLALLSQGDNVALATAGEPAGIVLVAARALGEPIARYGPFVMNTRQEVTQALDDYRAGRL